MRCEAHYPGDFKDALQRPLKAEELDELLKKPSPLPIFVYGHLILPTVLKYCADIPQTTKVDMVLATLPGYKLYQFSEDSDSGPPTIKPCPSAVVEGMLVFGLTNKQRAGLYDVEGVLAKTAKYIDIQVQVSQIDMVRHFDVRSQKSVDAGAFEWGPFRPDRPDRPEYGLEPMGTSFWPIDEFIAGQLYETIVRYQNRLQVPES
ncbi:hypothetical protein BDW62DRAFT_186008 [Aspergillus aurantiobrunneus]